MHIYIVIAGYQHLFGTDANSWAWDIPSGCMLHNGQTKQVFGDKMQIKEIYMTLDMNRGTLYFQPKSMEKFQAFSGIDDMLYELIFFKFILVYVIEI